VKPAAEQGIRGTVSEVFGNRMPMKGATESKPKGIAAQVLIYEATQLDQVVQAGAPTLFASIQTKQIASVWSDSLGHFSVALPVGKYSLFIRQEKGFYANAFDQFNHIALFEVVEGKYTDANLLISSKAIY